MIKIEKVEQGMKYENVITMAFSYNAETVAKIKTLPNRWYRIADRSWEVPIEDFSLVIKMFGIDNLQVADKSILESVLADGTRTAIERLDSIQPVIPFIFKTNPFPHQIEGFNYGVTKQSLLIADEQGLGKTKEAIDIAVARKNNGEVKKCLIICGVNSVKYNWDKEIKIHSNEKSFILDADSTDNRLVQLKQWIVSDKLFGVINIESLRKESLVEELVRYIDKGLLEMIVVDEIHKAKNGQCLQGKMLRKLKPKYRYGLTGTPIMNKADELWNIFSWLGVEKKSFYAFRNTYCTMGGYGNYQIVGYKNLDELNLRLNRVMLRRKKDEVLDLPDKIQQTDYIEMSDRHRQIYNEIRLGLISEIDDIVLNPNPLTSLLRLRQCTGGVIGEDNPKLDRLMELVEEITASGKKAVVFSQWAKVTKNLRKKMKKFNPAYIDGDIKSLDRQKEVDRFQNDKTCKAIIGTIGAMGTGLTLTAGTYVIFMDKAWTPADNEQAMDRCHRIGTTGTVNVITLVVKNSIDERIEEVLVEKRKLFEQIVEGKNIPRTNRKELLDRLLSMD